MVALESCVMIIAPRYIATQHTVRGNTHRWLPAGDLQRVTTHKVSRSIRLIELLTEQTRSLGTEVRHHAFFDIAFDHPPGVEH